jgi:hypothetical protein
MVIPLPEAIHTDLALLLLSELMSGRSGVEIEFSQPPHPSGKEVYSLHPLLSVETQGEQDRDTPGRFASFGTWTYIPIWK